MVKRLGLLHRGQFAELDYFRQNTWVSPRPTQVRGAAEPERKGDEERLRSNQRAAAGSGQIAECCRSPSVSERQEPAARRGSPARSSVMTHTRVSRFACASCARTSCRTRRIGSRHSRITTGKPGRPTGSMTSPAGSNQVSACPSVAGSRPNWTESPSSVHSQHCAFETRLRTFRHAHHDRATCDDAK